ncbi:nuclear transport factor 2 family protein [Streptomyces sp. NPDC002537]
MGSELRADLYVTAELYAGIEQFYARQMGLLDQGRAEEWAATFTEDAVFQDAAAPDRPAVGRSVLGALARGHRDRLVAERTDFRHWTGMLDVRPQPDGSLHTRTYALTLRTGLNQPLDITASVVCRDRLVSLDGRWLVRHRSLRRDGTAAAAGPRP